MLISGVPLKVPPVEVNMLERALEAVVPVPVVGIRYATVYSPVRVDESLIFVQP